MKAKYILIIAGVFGFVACNVQEENYEDARLGTVSFHAVNGDDSDTKTEIQSDGTILWSPYDKIDIFVGTQSYEFQANNGTPSAEATFLGSFNDASWDESNEYWAVYPHSSNNSSDGTTVTLSLPNEQKATAGTFAKDLFISMAKSNDYNLTFYNVCGGIKFSVTESGVQSVTFKGNNNEAIAGTASVAFDNEGKPYIKDISESKAEVTLSATNGATLEVGKWYYIVCFPSTLEKGYTLTLNKSDGTIAERKNENPATIKRAMWGRFTDSDKELTYNIPTNEIWYYTKDGEPVTHTPPYITGIKLVSHTYENGHGTFRYDGPVTTIPQWTLGYPDPESWDGASCNYYELNDVTKIVLPTSVKKIETSAIVNLKSLVELCLPEGIEVIEASSISSCEKLDNIIIPASVNSFLNVFYRCPSLKHLSVAEGNAKYDSRNNCNAVIETATNTLAVGCAGTVIPSSIKIIKTSAFSFSSIASVTIPQGVVEIGGYAFQNCSNLTSVSIPNSVTKIGRAAFMDCTSLTTIKLPDNQPEIGESAFYNTHIESLSIPSGWTSISEWAFAKNIFLKQISFPDTMQSIGAYAFYNCSSLETLEIPASVSSVMDSAFEGCTGLKQIRIWAETPPGPVSAFSYTGTCPIYVPAGSVDVYKATWSSSSIRSRIQPITQPNNEIWYRTSDGKALEVYNYTDFGATLVSNTYSGGLGILTFDADVTKISSGAFDRENVVFVSLPSTLQSIGYRAFEYSSIESITIPDSVTSIDSGAFAFCNSLRRFLGKFASEDGKMLITDGGYYEKKLIAYADPDATSLNFSPEGIDIDYMGGYALSSCASLKTLSCSIAYCDYDAFYGCVAENVTFDITTASTAFSGGSYDTILPEMKNLTIVAPEDSYYSNVMSLGWGLSKLESITLPLNFTVSEDFGPMATLLPYGCKIYGPNASSDHSCWIVDGNLVLFAFPENTYYYRLPNNITKISANLSIFGENWPNNTYQFSYSDWAGQDLYLNTNIGVIVPNSVTQILSPFSFRIPAYFESYTPPTITSFETNSFSERRAFIYVQQYYLDTYKTAWADYLKDAEGWQTNPDKIYLFTYYSLPGSN